MPDYTMTEIDPLVFLNIGKLLVQDSYNNEYWGIFNNSNQSNTKTYEDYKEEYLQKLHDQLNNLKKHKTEKVYEYNLKTEFHKKNNERITYLNRKLRLENINISKYSNSAKNFITLNTIHITKKLHDTMQISFETSKQLHEMEKEIEMFNYCISKTNEYIKQYTN